MTSYVISDRVTNERREYRIGLIHHVFKGDYTISCDEDIPPHEAHNIIEKFEELEREVDKVIQAKTEEFNKWLNANGYESGMGSIGRKEVK